MNIKFGYLIRPFFNSSNVCHKYSTKCSPVPLAFATFHPKKPLDAPPVVIMHGLLGSKRNWKTLGKVISDRTGRTVYTLDARNHGGSPFCRDMNYYVLSQDILHFMDVAAIKKACLIGHSMGGRAVMAVALHNPEVVEKLFVLDVSPFKSGGSDLSFLPKFFDLTLSNAIPNGARLQEARKHFDSLLSPLVPNHFLRSFLLTNLVEENGSVKWTVNLKSLAENYDPHLTDFAPAKDGHVFKGESYFIGGQLSDYIRYSDHERIRGLFPKAEFFYVEGAGHWLHSEKPQLFLDTVSPLICPSLN